MSLLRRSHSGRNSSLSMIEMSEYFTLRETAGLCTRSTEAVCEDFRVEVTTMWHDLLVSDYVKQPEI